MTKIITLKAKIRTAEDKKLNKIRSKGDVPAVVYGPGSENINLLIKGLDLEKAYQSIGESSLLDLTIGNQEPVKVVIKHLDYDPVKGNVIHADFYQVDMNKKMTVEVALGFIGESRAVKDLGAILVKNLNTLEIECLPKDLIAHIDIDLSQLKELNDVIRVSDLKISDHVRIVNDPAEAIVIAEEPKKQEEFTVAPVAETPAADVKTENKDAKSE